MNKLKDDAIDTIKALNDCGINTKIITGDDIFLGVQTAMMVGMIPIGAKIRVVKGQLCQGEGKPARLTQLERLQNG